MSSVQGSIPVAPVFRRWTSWGYVGAGSGGGRVPDEWAEILRRDPYMRDVVMVIELVFGGQSELGSLIIATQPVHVASSRDGKQYGAMPVLIEEPEINHEISFGSGTSSARALTFTLDGRLVDAPQLIRRGAILAGFAEVSLMVDGMDHDDRYVLIRGDITTVRFGAADELVELEVVDPKETIGSMLPPWVIEQDRFAATLHQTAPGERYPIVQGKYTAVPAIRLTDVAVGSNDFVYARGSDFTIDAVFVDGVQYASGDSVYGWAEVSRVDRKGEPYSVVDFTVGTTSWPDNTSVHVSCTGLARSEERNVIKALRRILEDFSPLGQAGTNAELFATAEAKIPVRSGTQILVNASGSSSGTALEWAEGTYLQSFPMISMVWENGAYGPVVVDRRAPVQAEWVAGQVPLLDRDTLCEETPKAGLFNEFVLRYDYDPVLDVYQKVQVRGPENSDLCRLSESLVGTMHHEVIESPYIVSDSLASYVIDWLVEHYALPSYVVDYVCTPDVLLRHRRGDRINITDPELGFDSDAATIERITYRRGRAVVTLRVWVRYLTVGGASRSYRRRSS